VERTHHYAWQQVTLEPWREEAHRRLMRVLAASGQRSAALAQYETCRRLLAEELGVEPSAEIRETYELLLRGEQPPDLAIILAEQERPPRKVGECPYRGLAAFQEADAPFFFGREDFTGRLVEAVQQQPVGTGSGLVYIVGSSGSGKSSTVLAGLLPRLRGSDNWLIVRLRPGAQPFHALANALLNTLTPELGATNRLLEARKLADALAGGDLTLSDVVAQALAKELGGRRLLLVIDQFEELYALCPEPSLRRRFVDLLLTALDSGGEDRAPSPVLLLTMRADFMGQALAYRPLADALQDAVLLLGPMNRNEMRAAVERPAEAQGAAFEAGLVERILDDVGEEPGNLPLLEFALTLLWERHSRGWLTHAGYEEIGRVDGALARHADEVYAGLAQADQTAAPQVFVQLVRPGEGTEDTRRAAVRSELGEAHWRLVQHLADKRLVVTGRDVNGVETVEVVHEALIRSWGQLQGWMEADRAFRTWQERMRAALRQWQDTSEDEGTLLRGAPLVEAEGWLGERSGELGEAEREFIQAGVALQETQRQRDLEAARRLAESEGRRAEDQAHAAARLRRRALLLAGASILAVALAAIALLAFNQANRNAETAQAASTRAVGQQEAAQTAQALEAAQRATAEAEGWARATQQAVAEAEAGARAAQQAVAEEQARLATSRELANAAINNLSIDPERSTLLALHALKTADTLEARNALHHALPELHILRSLVAHDQPVTAVTFSPDSELLASSSADQTTKIWNAQTGELLRTLQYEKNTWWDVRFSPDGKILAASTYTQVIGLDPQTGQQLFALKGQEVGWSTGYDLGASRVDFSPDGRLLAVANMDGHPVVWDLATRTRMLTLSGHKGMVRSIDFSPDGKLLATGSEDGTVRVWDAITGQQLSTLSQTTTSWFGVRFSPDGSHLAAGNEGSTLKVWELGGWKEVMNLARPEAGGFRSLAWSPDGTALVTASYDGVIRMWDATSGQLLLLLPGHTSTVLDVDFSADGKRLVSCGVDRTIKTWDLGLGKELLTIQADSVYVRVAYSPDGSQLATTGVSGAPKLWDAATGQLLRSLPATDLPHVLMSVAYSRDGRLLAAGSAEGIVTLWDLERDEVALSWQGHGNAIAGIAFSPDGKRVATSSHDGMATVWDVDTGQALTTFDAHARHASSPQMQMVFGVAFSPDGQRIASASYDGTVRVWNSATGQEIYSVSDGPAIFSAAAFSPDGLLLAAGEFDGPLLIVDAATGQVLHKCTGHSGGILDLRFSMDSKVVASASFDRLAKLWDAASGQELATFYGNAKNAWSVSLTPDGRRVAVGGWDGTARIFVTGLDELVELAKSRLTRSLTTEECQKYLHVAECP